MRLGQRVNGKTLSGRASPSMLSHGDLQNPNSSPSPEPWLSISPLVPHSIFSFSPRFLLPSPSISLHRGLQSFRLRSPAQPFAFSDLVPSLSMDPLLRSPFPLFSPMEALAVGDSFVSAG